MGMIILTILLVWWFIGLIPLFYAVFVYTHKELTVGDLFAFLIVSVGGPITCFVFLIDYMEERDLFSRVVRKGKNDSPWPEENKDER